MSVGQTRSLNSLLQPKEHSVQNRNDYLKHYQDKFQFNILKMFGVLQQTTHIHNGGSSGYDDIGSRSLRLEEGLE